MLILVVIAVMLKVQEKDERPRQCLGEGVQNIYSRWATWDHEHLSSLMVQGDNSGQLIFLIGLGVRQTRVLQIGALSSQV